MNDVKLVVLSLSFFQVAYRFCNNNLQSIFFNDIPNNQPKLHSIYLAQVAKKQPSIGCYLLNLGANQQAILKITKNSGTFHEGQKILVQVVKEPTVPNKHAVVSAEIAINFPLLIYKPLSNKIIFSKNIPANDHEKITTTLNLQEEGIVIRSSFKHNLLAELLTNYQEAKKLWQEMQSTNKLGLLYKPNFLKGLIINNSKLLPNEIIANNTADITFCKNFIQENPYLNTQLVVNNENNPMYSNEVLLNYLTKLSQPNLQINQELSLNYFETEAFNYIDVDYKGNYSLYTNKEEALYRANLNALAGIANTIILKNLSGQIMVDVLKVTGKQYRNNLIKALQKYFVIDENKTTVLGFSNLGILEISRQKLNDSLSIYSKYAFNYKVFKLFLHIMNMAKQKPLSNINIICSKTQQENILSLASTEIEYINSWLKNPLQFKIVEDSKVPTLKVT